ncbi:hypothetical protein Tco_0531356 [Tanacetum coccineum]
MGLWYTKDSGFELTGFSDADYAEFKDTFKSTSGGAQFLGKKLVSWSSKKQDCMALSTAKAEYVSLSACCAQVLWMRTQLTDYGFYFNKIPIYYDSKSAIAISCNLVQHSRTKHIVVCYHFIKEHMEKGMIELYFVKRDYQLADLFTKALPVDRFTYLVRRLGMRNSSPQELEHLAKSRVEGMKRNCKTKVKRKKALPYNLRQNQVPMHNHRNHKDDSDIEDKSSWTPVINATKPSLATQNLSKDFCFISHGDQHISIGFLIPRSEILKRWQSAPASDYQITNEHL